MLMALLENDREALGIAVFESFGTWFSDDGIAPELSAEGEEFRTQLLTLPEDVRSDIGHELLESVQSEEVEAELIAELERREADMLSGKSIPIPAEEVFAQIDAHLAAIRAERVERR